MTPDEFKIRLHRLFRFMGAKNDQDGADRIGISNATVSRWIHGHRNPSRLALRLIQDAEKKYCPKESREEQSVTVCE